MYQCIMQASYKKRKIGSPPENDGWDNDITAEEFDLWESQAVTTIPIVSSRQIPSLPKAVHQSDIEKLRDEQLAQEGQICLLRHSLVQKSLELDKERLEREKKIAECMKEHQQKETRLHVDNNRLESEIKFKQHELNNALELIRSLQEKAKLAANVSSVKNNTIKHLSPVKIPLNISVNKFENKPLNKHSTTQTEKPREICQSARECLLTSHTAYGSSALKLITNGESSSIEIKKSNLIRPCKGDSLNKQFNLFHLCYTRPAGNSFHFPKVNLSNMPLHTTCYCSNISDISAPSQEMYSLKNIELHLKKYRDFLIMPFFQNESTCENNTVSSIQSTLNDTLAELDFKIRALQNSPESSRKAHRSLLTTNTALYLCDLCKILSSSSSARTLLMKPNLTARMDVPVSQRDELIYLITACASPLMCKGEIANQSVIEWALTALIILSSYFGPCCFHLFENVIQGINLNNLLDGSCGLEVAYLAILLITFYIEVKDVFVHHDDSCILRTLGRLLKSQVFYKNVCNSMHLKQLITNIVNWITDFMSIHGTSVLFHDSCKCLGQLLQLLLAGFLEYNFQDKDLVLQVFKLLQMLYRELDKVKWYDLRSRMKDSFFLMINKIEHTELLTLPELQEIILELCENVPNLDGVPSPMEIV